MSNTIYGIKACDTMKKARAWLESHRIDCVFHDYRVSGLEPDRLDAWVGEVGWQVLLNKASTSFRALPEAEQRPELPSVEGARPPERPVPSPPRNGTVLRGYCSYLERDPSGKLVRAKRFYYEENPDRWAAETQSDILWFTGEETRSLVPADIREGARVEGLGLDDEHGDSPG